MLEAMTAPSTKLLLDFIVPSSLEPFRCAQQLAVVCAVALFFWQKFCDRRKMKFESIYFASCLNLDIAEGTPIEKTAAEGRGQRGWLLNFWGGGVVL